MSESSSVEVRETSGQKTWLGIGYLVERTGQNLVYVCQHHLQMVLRGSIYYKTPFQYSALRAALIHHLLGCETTLHQSEEQSTSQQQALHRTGAISLHPS